MARRKRGTPEEQARRALISELLSAANVQSMDDIQNLFKETIAEFVEGSLESTGSSCMKKRCCRTGQRCGRSRFTTGWSGRSRRCSARWHKKCRITAVYEKIDEMRKCTSLRTAHGRGFESVHQLQKILEYRRFLRVKKAAVFFFLVLGTIWELRTHFILL